MDGQIIKKNKEKVEQKGIQSSALIVMCFIVREVRRTSFCETQGFFYVLMNASGAFLLQSCLLLLSNTTEGLLHLDFSDS